MRNPLRRRYQVAVDYLAPRLMPRRSRRFYFHRSAERYALLFDREAWRLGFLTQSTVSDIP